MSKFVVLLLLLPSVAIARPDIEAKVQADVRAGRFQAAIAGISASKHLLRGGYSLRARLLLLTGQFQQAAADYRELARYGGAGATVQLQAEAAKHASTATELQRLSKRVRQLHSKAKCQMALEGLQTLLRHARAAPELYLLRGECRFLQRDVLGAHADASRAHSIAPHEPAPWLLLARVLYVAGEGGDLGPSDPSMRCLSRCLAIAPDHKGCVALRKWVGGVNASLATAASLEANGEHAAAIEELKSVLQRHEDASVDLDGVGTLKAALKRVPMPRAVRRRVFCALCRLSEAMGETEGVLHWCGGVASLHVQGEREARAVLDTARALIWIAMVRLQRLQAMAEPRPDELKMAGGALQHGMGLLDEVERLQAMAKEAGSKEAASDEASAANDEVSAEVGGLRGLCHNLRNQLLEAQQKAEAHGKEEAVKESLYEVLGLEAHATLAMIKAAYRKLVLLWHPDKYDGDEPDEAVRRFHKIVDAYETLSDAAQRREYDGGQQQQSHPFHSGTPFQFEFPDKEVLTDQTCPVAKRGFDKGWREGWRRTLTGWRQRAFMNIGAAKDAPKRSLLALDKPGLQPRPQGAGHVTAQGGLDHVNVTFEPPRSGAAPTIYFLLLHPPRVRLESNSMIGGGDDTTLCLGALPVQVGGHRRRTSRSGTLRMSAGGLSAGTAFEFFSLTACTTLGATACEHWHPTECSTSMIPTVTTAQPPFGATSDGSFGSFDGGGWHLVRRVVAGAAWHPATDSLSGRAEYGACNEAAYARREAVCSPQGGATFSRRFEHIEYAEMLFSSGDGQRWMHMLRPHGNHEMGRDGRIKLPVLKSHLHTLPYDARFLMQDEGGSTPHVRTDLRPYEDDPLLYAEAERPTRASELWDEQGANVWIRPWVVRPPPRQEPPKQQQPPRQPTGRPLGTAVSGAAPAKQTQLPAGVCMNFHPSCRSWANEGECEANPIYMKRWCCGACCKDVANNRTVTCRAWALRGECDSNPAYMKSTCCESCCKDDPDHKQHCKSWAQTEQCTNNSAWMGVHCCASCRLQTKAWESSTP